MIETLLGTLLGGSFRIVPEVMKFFDRKNERSHELSMFDKQLDAEELKAKTAQQQADNQIGAAEIQAIIEATKSQAVQTGVRWVDGLNALIRPLLALKWLILLWPSVIVAGFILAVQSGVNPLEAFNGAFGTEEKAMASSVASFWLVDRSLRKK